MTDTYKIVFMDEGDVVVRDPDIDEEHRVVKVEKTIHGEDTAYDYYPFEAIKMILFMGSGE
jgi:hypothetical protein